MTLQGRMQHWQSSPHQQGNLTGGFDTGPLAIEEPEVEEVAEVVEGGIVSRAAEAAYGRRWRVEVYWLAGWC